MLLNEDNDGQSEIVGSMMPAALVDRLTAMTQQLPLTDETTLKIRNYQMWYEIW